MAGKRRDTGKPTRQARRSSYWAREIAAASRAPEPDVAQFTAVTRWFRAMTRGLDPAARAAELNAASRELSTRADRIWRQS
jgi:hypothetical protein